MLDFPRWKILFIVFICLGGFYFAAPNLWQSSLLPQDKLNLGLDLRGGSYLLLEVDTEHYFKERLATLKQDIRKHFRGERIDGKRIQYRGGIRLHKDKLTIELLRPETEDQVVSLLRDLSRDLDITASDGTITIAYLPQSLKTMRQGLIEQSVEIVRRRVDETGTREPDIQRQGDDRILLQVPGLNDPEQLKRLLGKTAKLTFHLVDDSVPAGNQFTPAPSGSMRLPADGEDGSYVVRREIMIQGNELVDARSGVRDGFHVVNIRFDQSGAKKFADVTKVNIGKPFAIVLDGKVITAPVIRSAILGGAAEISGQFDAASANDLAILLRSGALPAPLDIIEERTVGPSLGLDSIEAGKHAVLAAIAFVILFMVIIYKRFGIISDIALLVNLVLIIAVLSLVGATLTLPGIAGIVLTMGMAVDANVLIFERIREELRIGKTPYAAIDNGFRQAFKTILDANITTLIAAILLYGFGSGPVKGFAVTLSVGIITSVFSATLLTRMMVVLFYVRKGKKRSSLSV